MAFVVSSRWQRSAALAFGLLVSSCGGEEAPETPPYNALFDPLPAATPGKLRGVWAFDQTSPEGPAQLRLRFSEGAILAGIKCSYNRPGYDPVIAGQSAGAEITGLDESKGTLVPAQGLSFLSKPDARVCQGTFAKDDYEFTVQDTTLTFTVKGKLGTLVFQKVGD